MKRLSLSLFALAAFGLMACSEEEASQPTPDTGGNPPADTGTDASAPDTSTDPGDGTCPDPRWQDATYRVTSVQIAKPGGIGRALQGLMNQDFSTDTLHILVQVRDFDACSADASMELTGNAGARSETEEGAYTWFPGVDVEWKPAELQASGDFRTLDTLSLTFPALVPGEEATYLEIPVVDLNIEGILEVEEGASVAYAVLTGAILEADIEDISVSLIPGNPPRPLPDLLNRNSKDYPVDSDVKTGWQLEAEVEAVTVRFAP